MFNNIWSSGCLCLEVSGLSAGLCSKVKCD